MAGLMGRMGLCDGPAQFIEPGASFVFLVSTERIDRINLSRKGIKQLLVLLLLFSPSISCFYKDEHSLVVF